MGECDDGVVVVIDEGFGCGECVGFVLIGGFL